MSGLWLNTARAVDAADKTLRSARSAGDAKRISEARVAREGAVDHWARLVARREYRNIHAAWQFGVSREDAEQIAAAAALSAAEAHPGAGPLSSYLYVAVRNSIVDLLRSAQPLEPSDSSDVDVSVGEVFQSGADQLVGRAFERLLRNQDTNGQRCLAAALNLAEQRERVTVQALASGAELTTDQARRAWDRVRAVFSSLLNEPSE